MDQKLFDELLGQIGQAPSSPPPATTAQPAPLPQGGVSPSTYSTPIRPAPMDQNLFDDLLKEVGNQPRPAAPAAPVPADRASEQVVGPPAPVTDASPAPEVQGPPMGPDWTDPARLDQSGRVGGAIVAGAGKAIFETKDFLFGPPEPGQRSELRRNVELLDDRLKGESAGYGFISSVSQFATGMLGAGKVAAGLKGIRGVGRFAASLGSAGRVAGESAKAATVGAVAFDPHGGRLSDLVESYPALSNPVTQFLRSKPDDTDAEGRFKNALESLGMDAAIIGTMKLAVGAYKWRLAGDPGKAAAAERDLAVHLEGSDAPVPGGPSADRPGLQPVGEAPEAPGGAVLSDRPASPPEAAARDGGAPHPEAPSEAAERSAPQGEVTVHPDESGENLTFRSAGGEGSLVTKVRDGRLIVDAAHVAEEKRGQGHGLRLYEEAIRYAGEHGLTFHSDADVHADAVRVYAALRRRGYEVAETHGTITTPEGMKQSPRAGEPAFEVKPPPGAPQAAPAAETRPLEVTVHPSSPEAGAEVTQVASPAAGAPEGGLPAPPRLFDLPEHAVSDIVSTAVSDAKALAEHGSFEAAVEAGHVFGKGESIPYQKMVGNQTGEPRTALDAFMQRVTDWVEADIEKAKGGAVQPDAHVDNVATHLATVYGEDPAAVIGALQATGKGARQLAASMEASFRIAQKAGMDAMILAQQIGAGYIHPKYGTKEVAAEALRAMLEVSATAHGAGRSMLSNAGRALRRARSEFVVDADMLAQMKSLEPEALAKLVESTGGDARAMAQLVEPSLWKRGMDYAQFLYVNNLLWGPRTHFVNLSTNLYMIGARPLERIAGSFAVGGEAGARLRAENWKQYAYMGSVLSDSWRTAVEAWKIGDSVLTPHLTEANTVGNSIGQAVVDMGFKPFDSLPNVLHNAVAVGAKTLGAPTRALGAADELMKQVVYRSKVLAAAHVEGVERGLKGDDLTAFVRDKLYGAFDDAGRALDLDAVREAQVATFQQDLLPGTIGSTVQAATANHPALRFILPFVKTPTNVIRMGIKLTPGLNLLQQEYREMIRGSLGPEAHAQAVGQMAMGSLFMGSAAYLAHTGLITGGGPSDAKLKAQLMATGWQPYSYVKANADGSKTYTPYGRYDPIAMPLGLMADLVDILSTDQDGAWVAAKVEAGSMALLLGMVKNLGSKSYLTSLTQVLDAIAQPGDDTRGKVGKVAGSMAASLVPAASLLRFANPDPYLRDARDIVDNIMATVPGLSDKLPARYDAWGDPITVHKGLWVDGKAGIVDAEVQRMIDTSGVGPGVPNPTFNGADLRDVTMQDGRNAYEAYQQLAGRPTPRTKPLKEVVARVMESEGYRKAPDGEAGARGTKLSMIAPVISRYRDAAFRMIQADPNVRAALAKRDQEVRAHYAAQRNPPAPTNQPAAQMKALGDAFGVDLSPYGGAPARNK